MLSKLIYQLTSLISLIVSLLTFLSLFGRYPFLELTTHFRLQYLWLSLICLASLCAFQSWKFSSLVLFCAVLNGIYILPYYFSTNQPRENVPTNSLRLMSANVEGRNKNYEDLIEAVKSANPDILVLQEVTEAWWLQVQVFNDIYPYSKGIPQAGGGGLAIFSRYPVEQADLLTIDASPHPALFSKINLDGTIISILTIHPPTPMRTDKFANRNEQFRQSALIMKSAPEPKLLIGDLNTTMWSPYFADLVKDSGLRDARLGKGLYPSWHAALPAFLKIPIDHCLVSEKIEVEKVKIADFTGSDHHPLIVDLKVEKSD